MEGITRAIIRRHKKGLSATEIMMLGLISLIGLVVMASILMRMYGNVVVESHKVLLRAEAQAVAHKLYNELSASRNFSSRPVDEITDSYAPAEGWQASPTILLTKQFLRAHGANQASEPAITLQPDCIDAAPFYMAYFTTTNAYNNLNSLYKRQLIPPVNMLCDDSTSMQTCPPENTQPHCPADELLSDRVSDFSLQYLDASGAVLPVFDPTSTATPETATSVRISLTISEVAYGKTIKESASVLIHGHEK